MARNLSLDAVLDKNLTSSSDPYIIALDIAVIGALGEYIKNIRVVNNDEPVSIEGVLYAPVRFTMKMDTGVGETPKVTVSLNDAEGMLSTDMEYMGGLVGSKISIIVTSASRANTAPDIKELFFISEANSGGGVINWTIDAGPFLTRKFPPRRQFSDICSHRFKSAACGYAGANNSCSLTLDGENGCVSHLNEVRFGGFSGIQQS